MTKAATKPEAIGDPVDAANAEVGRLAALERDFARQRQAKAGELAKLVSEGGDQVVDAALSGDQDAVTRGLGRRVADLRGEVDALDAAGASTRRRRREAIPRVREAQAAAAEGRAAKLEAEADEHQRENDRLLAALEEHAGCRYAPAQPVLDGPVTGPGLGSVRVVVYGAPRFQVLRDEAAGLRRTAAELRRQQTIAHGTANGVGIEALIEAVLSDPMRIGPAIGDLVRWSLEVEERERRRRARVANVDNAERVLADRSVAVGLHVTWRGGEIVAAESGAFGGFSPEAGEPVGQPVDVTVFDSAAEIADDPVFAEAQ
jgi:hypothetical protein